jgi:hypothetical protein
MLEARGCPTRKVKVRGPNEATTITAAEKMLIEITIGITIRITIGM